MNAEQRTAALLCCRMSEVGYRKVTNIRRLEEVLRQMGSPSVRDPEQYAFVFLATSNPLGDGASRVIIFP